jgi:hypothetical protein
MGQIAGGIKWKVPAKAGVNSSVPTSFSHYVRSFVQCCKAQNVHVLTRPFLHLRIHNTRGILCIMYVWAGYSARYELKGSGIEFCRGRYFPYPSRSSLGPTQLPIQWVPGVKRPGRGVNYPPSRSVPTVNFTSTCLCRYTPTVFMVWLRACSQYLGYWLRFWRLPVSLWNTALRTY